MRPFIIRQKCYLKEGDDLSNGIKAEIDWKEQAEALFFVEHMPIGEIADIVKKNRRHVSNAIKASANYDYKKEYAWRKEQSRKKRKDYQREWDRSHRAPQMGEITQETIRREHDMAVAVLSREKYY